MIPAAALLDKDYGFFTRDPTQVGQVPFYAGYVSSLGVLSWTVAAAVALFSSSVLVELAAEPEQVLFLRYFGSLTAWLALDDLFLIHENLPVNEKATFLLYLLITAAGCLYFGKQFRHFPSGFAIAAGAFFAVSLIIDRLQSPLQAEIGDLRIFFEDGTKFLGTVCWAIFLCKTGIRAISEGSSR